MFTTRDPNFTSSLPMRILFKHNLKPKNIPIKLK